MRISFKHSAVPRILYAGHDECALLRLVFYIGLHNKCIQVGVFCKWIRFWGSLMLLAAIERDWNSYPDLEKVHLYIPKCRNFSILLLMLGETGKVKASQALLPANGVYLNGSIHFGPNCNWSRSECKA